MLVDWKEVPCVGMERSGLFVGPASLKKKRSEREESDRENIEMHLYIGAKQIPDLFPF